MTLAKSVSFKLCGSYGAVLSALQQGAVGPRMGEWRALVQQKIHDHKTVVAVERKRKKGFVLVPA